MGKNDKKKKAKGGKSAADDMNEWIMVDPSRIRFQHARIRPYFSGCGRPVEQTLTDIREGKLKPDELPPIQVIIGPEEEGERWYFSLNNRRLWVLKRCREEGLLDNNQIRVRWRQSKSKAEAERYTLQNCAEEAKFVRESAATKTKQTKIANTSTAHGKSEGQVPVKQPGARKGNTKVDRSDDEQSSDCDDSSDDDEQYSNPFSALV